MMKADLRQPRLGCQEVGASDAAQFQSDQPDEKGSPTPLSVSLLIDSRHQIEIIGYEITYRVSISDPLSQKGAIRHCPILWVQNKHLLA
jgi:hypothetical protein